MSTGSPATGSRSTAWLPAPGSSPISPAAAADPVRVYLVDDSALARRALAGLLRSGDGFVVVGEGADGRQAVRGVRRTRPDVVLMDVVMPGRDGLAATRDIMGELPTPILLISELVGRDAGLNFKAMQAGALEVVRKPTLRELQDPASAERLRRLIRRLAAVPVVTRRRGRGRTGPSATAAGHSPRPAATTAAGPPPARVGLVCLGASTGGPPALANLLGGLPAPLPWPVVAVQHMTSGFTAGLVRWLGQETGHTVVVARPGERPEAGRVYFAPDGVHTVLRGGRFRHQPAAAGDRHCPGVDPLFRSVAEAPEIAEICGILLTGMGRDGADGLGRMRRAGAWTIAQDAATSVVYGMPQAAVEAGAACETLGLPAIGERLRRWLKA